MNYDDGFNNMANNPPDEQEMMIILQLNKKDLSFCPHKFSTLVVTFSHQTKHFQEPPSLNAAPD